MLLLHLIEGVEIADHLVEEGGVKIGVDLGRLDAVVPQQFLQYPQVGPTRVHVGGKGMRQHGRRYPLGLAKPAATAFSLISSRAAWRGSALLPSRSLA
jgi:hypothetical protein